MSFSGGQQADLMQAALAGSYDFYLEREGAWLGDSSEGSVNIPWILSLSLSLGNAYTQGIAEGSVAWPEPEWGFDASGPGRDIAPGEQMIFGLGGVGGFVRSW